LKFTFAAVAKIYRQKMYMWHFGNPSVKATCLWSNSSGIGKLDLGPVTRDSLTFQSLSAQDCVRVSLYSELIASQEASRRARALAKTYRDRYGKKRVTGLKKELKQSQCVSYRSRRIAGFNWPGLNTPLLEN
jgi:hypothetical protein